MEHKCFIGRTKSWHRKYGDRSNKSKSRDFEKCTFSKCIFISQFLPNYIYERNSSPYLIIRKMKNDFFNTELLLFKTFLEQRKKFAWMSPFRYTNSDLKTHVANIYTPWLEMTQTFTYLNKKTVRANRSKKNATSSTVHEIHRKILGDP